MNIDVPALLELLADESAHRHELEAITSLSLSGDEETLERVVGHPLLRSVRAIAFEEDAELDEEVLHALVRGPIGATLVSLSIKSIYSSTVLCPLLSADLPALRELVFAEECDFEEEEVRMLARATFTPSLETLALYTYAGERLADPPLTSLRELRSKANSDEVATAIATNVHLGQLRHLILLGDHVGTVGAVELANATNLGNLEVLELPSNHVDGAGLVALLRSRDLPALRRLDLRDNDFDDCQDPGWCEALLSVGRFAPLLEDLTLGSSIGDAVARTFVERAPPTLCKLALPDHGLSDACAEELMRRANLRGMKLVLE